MRFFLIFLALISCSVTSNVKEHKSEDKPKWLQNPKSVYADKYYLSAIGQGDSRQQAIDMAMANLAKIFEVKIDASETIDLKYLEIFKNEKWQLEEKSEIHKNIKIKSNEMLFNVQFGESYTDEMGQVFAVAYLNRFETAQIYKTKISENSARIEYFTSQESADILQRYTHLVAASSLAQKNDVLQGQLKIIAHNLVEKLDYDFQQIIENTKKTAQNIGFTINVKNDENGKIKIAIISLLTDLGFVVSNKPILKIDGKINFTKTDLKRDIKFIRYEFQLQVSNRDEIIVAITQNGREGHFSQNEAKARCIRTIEKIINSKMKQKIVTYFGSLMQD